MVAIRMRQQCNTEEHLRTEVAQTVLYYNFFMKIIQERTVLADNLKTELVHRVHHSGAPKDYCCNYCNCYAYYDMDSEHFR